jgi:2-polyprenyl-3-methyl-5-hydroxy-6-metoxy-1,4-benzoquinol methylase
MKQIACCICEREVQWLDVELARVRCNVRAYSRELFAVWRCPRCKSIHASDAVDLSQYYAKYPFHDLCDDWRVRAVYQNQLARLEAAGVHRTQRVLDYGCGSGGFVRYLREHGYAHASGYDAFSPSFADRSVLDERYDAIVAQDVLEHVESPYALLTEFARSVRPGAAILIGTPNAEAVDLAQPEAFVHALHAPYHRHIFSRRALLAAGVRQGWQLDRFYPTMYTNTRVPFLNEAFYSYYARALDDSLDAILGPVQGLPLLARLPLTLFWGLFGSAFSRGTDGCAVFRVAAKGGP